MSWSDRCHPTLVARVKALMQDYELLQSGAKLIVTCAYRSPQEQYKLFQQGRSTPGPIVTQLDGVTRRSRHNADPAEAVDVAVLVSGKVSWDVSRYQSLGMLARRYGLEWGGDWPRFKDYPHLQLPERTEVEVPRAA